MVLKCECGFSSKRNFNMDRHRLSKTHELNMQVISNDNSANLFIATGLYECKSCKYSTHLKGNYRRHLLSYRHSEQIKPFIEVGENKNAPHVVPPPVLLVEVMEMMLKYQTEMIDKIGSQNAQNTVQSTEVFTPLHI